MQGTTPAQKAGGAGGKTRGLRALGLLAVIGSLMLASVGSTHAQIGGLNLSLSASPTSIAAGDRVHFDLSASPPSVRDGRIDSAVLDYGDGDRSDINGPF